MMMNKKILAAVFVITTLLVTSCNTGKMQSDVTMPLSEASSTVKESSPTETSAMTQADVKVTTGETSATENPTSKEETALTLPDWKDTPAEFVHYGFPYLGGNGSSYLISSESVAVIDESALDGIEPVEDGEKITLPVGTVVFFFDENQKPVQEIEQDICYMVLIDGRCIAFDTTYTEDNELRLNGKPTTEIFDGDPYCGPWDETGREETARPETVIIEEVNLGVDETLDQKYKKYKNINIWVDWNEDGITDSFCRTAEVEGERLTYQVIYTDGATGEKKDTTELFGAGDGFSDSIFFHKDSDGTPCLADRFDEGDHMACCTYIYDEESFVKKVYYGEAIYRYEEGVFYFLKSEGIFCSPAQNTDMLLEDGQFIPADKVITEWFRSDRSVITSIEDITKNSYITSFEDLPATDAEGNEVVIPAGLAIYPILIKYENIEKCEGIFSFCLVDGSIYTTGIEKNGAEFLFDGKRASAVFFLNYVGA